MFKTFHQIQQVYIGPGPGRWTQNQRGPRPGRDPGPAVDPGLAVDPGGPGGDPAVDPGVTGPAEVLPARRSPSKVSHPEVLPA